MPHPYTPAWHATQEAQERAWLDDWARLHHTPVLEQPAPMPAALTLTPAGSTR